MPYALVDLDITRVAPDTELPREQDGVALLLRDGNRPIAFELLASAPGTASWHGPAVTAAAQDLLAERLRLALLARATGGQPAAEPRGARQSVTVAVCTRDRPDDLRACLGSITAAAADVDTDVDVLVVDNAPPDEGTREVALRHGGVRYVREPVAGLDVARNRAVAEARGRWLAFVDDDVRVDRWWLHGLAAALVEHPEAAAVTGLVLPAQLETDAQVRFERGGGFSRGFRQQRWDGRHGPGGRLHPIGAGVFGAGCNMAFDVAVLRAVGGFDEALDTGPPLPGGGDLDIFFRVLAADRTLVYEPRMAVFHRHRRGMDELRRQYASWGSGFAAYLGARWTDPGERAAVRRMALWWLAHQQRSLRTALRQGDPVGARMVVAELAGGLAGSVDGYGRSRRRMARRRARHADAAGSPTAR